MKMKVLTFPYEQLSDKRQDNCKKINNRANKIVIKVTVDTIR